MLSTHVAPIASDFNCYEMAPNWNTPSWPRDWTPNIVKGTNKSFASKLKRLGNYPSKLPLFITFRRFSLEQNVFTTHSNRFVSFTRYFNCCITRSFYFSCPRSELSHPKLETDSAFLYGTIKGLLSGISPPSYDTIYFLLICCRQQ